MLDLRQLRPALPGARRVSKNTAPRRLPRKVGVGPYQVQVILATQTTLREVMDDDEGEGLFNGCWEPTLDDETDRYHGRIYILATLPMHKKWSVLWHELGHAMTDLEGWDTELRELHLLQKGGRPERWRKRKRSP